ncbi:MAG TPA: O-methyltransferase [Thermoanaerobaculia bacterium]|jgi:caffeoyl-CoA O-methyltransferase|nr:O-methyltransferase [Thermoanaerobaculia bacterium]
MKSRADAILKPKQADYLERLTPARDRLLARMEKLAAKHGHPIADPEVAQLERILVRALSPRHIIEVGTNIGYSVIAMGRECGPEALLETIELNEQTLATATEFVAQAKLACEVRFHQGAALDVLPRLAGPFDFAFIDCVKTEYEDYLDALLPKMKAGATIVCDNLLWGGAVAAGKHDPSTDALRKFNRRIMTDPRLTSIVLPLGDGTGISIVK